MRHVGAMHLTPLIVASDTPRSCHHAPGHGVIKIRHYGNAGYTPLGKWAKDYIIPQFYFILFCIPLIPNLGPIRARSRAPCRRKYKRQHASPLETTAIAVPRSEHAPHTARAHAKNDLRQSLLRCASVPHVRVVTPPHPRFRRLRGSRRTPHSFAIPFTTSLSPLPNPTCPRAFPFPFPPIIPNFSSINRLRPYPGLYPFATLPASSQLSPLSIASYLILSSTP